MFHPPLVLVLARTRFPHLGHAAPERSAADAANGQDSDCNGDIDIEDRSGFARRRRRGARAKTGETTIGGVAVVERSANGE